MGKLSWTTLVDYQGHEINTRGDIRHIATNNILQTSTNQTGVRYASIRNTTTNRYENKAVSVLVADTYCPGRTPQTDTVLHRDGNVANVAADNLMWANRYTAIAYHKEIHEGQYKMPKMILEGSGNRYNSIHDAAFNTGCTPSSIAYAIRYNDTLAQDEHVNFVHRIPPHGHTFRSIK